MFNKLYQRRLYMLALMLLCSLFFSINSSMAQDTTTPENEPIDFVGNITAIAQNTMIVDQRVVDISNVAVNVALQPGLTVRVQGVVQGSIVIAQVIEIVVDLETATPEVTPEPTPPEEPDDDPVVIIIEGPVQAININIITIFNFDVEVDPDEPMLNIIQVGDIIRVEGQFSDGLIVATVVSNIIGENPSGSQVVIEGPIQTINVNIITINNINILVDANDPILATIQIGDVIRVEGNFEGDRTNFVIVVVNIVVIQNVTVNGGGGGGNGNGKGNKGENDDDD